MSLLPCSTVPRKHCALGEVYRSSRICPTFELQTTNRNAAQYLVAVEEPVKQNRASLSIKSKPLLQKIHHVHIHLEKRPFTLLTDLRSQTLEQLQQPLHAWLKSCPFAIPSATIYRKFTNSQSSDHGIL
jgi:hypothetical protein